MKRILNAEDHIKYMASEDYKGLSFNPNLDLGEGESMDFDAKFVSENPMFTTNRIGGGDAGFSEIDLTNAEMQLTDKQGNKVPGIFAVGFNSGDGKSIINSKQFNGVFGVQVTNTQSKHSQKWSERAEVRIDAFYAE
jgi:hypothetical protein